MDVRRFLIIVSWESVLINLKIGDIFNKLSKSVTKIQSIAKIWTWLDGCPILNNGFDGSLAVKK